jgi:type II secretory pathway pseudopilin PulG
LSAGLRRKVCGRGYIAPFKGAACFSRIRGFSQTEVLVIIAVIGIMAAVSIGMLTGGVEASKETTARANLETLNYAVRKYSHAVKDMTNTAQSGSSDEVEVIAELKIDGTIESRPGSPYLEANISPVESSDANTYRASWNGSEFQLIGLGTNGIGINLLDLQ